MRVVEYQEILAEKLKRQEELLKMEGPLGKVQKHATGHCFHYGQISSGCRRCYTGEQGSGIQIGNKCMCNCPYCYYPVFRNEMPTNQINEMLSNWFFNSQQVEFDPNYRPTIFAYQSAGETLMYLDELEKFNVCIDEIARKTNMNHYKFLYTNGILANEDNLKRCQEMGIHEFRFHLSASNFSEQVYKNMEMAAKMGFICTVEEPSWQLHREQLFEMLPRMEEIGCKHLDMIEVQISPDNRDAIMKYYADDKYRAYKDYFYHLYDDGLVYDLMEEVIKKGYHYSVIDCSSAVERCRHNNDQDVLFDWETIKGACDPFNYNHPDERYNTY